MKALPDNATTNATLGFPDVFKINYNFTDTKNKPHETNSSCIARTALKYCIPDAVHDFEEQGELTQCGCHPVCVILRCLTLLVNKKAYDQLEVGPEEEDDEIHPEMWVMDEEDNQFEDEEQEMEEEESKFAEKEDESDSEGVENQQKQPEVDQPEVEEPEVELPEVESEVDSEVEQPENNEA